MIVLKLELNEVNVVLQALGQMPFIQVNSVIGKLQEQAGPQAQGPQALEERSEGDGFLHDGCSRRGYDGFVELD